MAFQELLRVRSVKHVEQKAFDGGVSHHGFPACVDCSYSLHPVQACGVTSMEGQNVGLV